MASYPPRSLVAKDSNPKTVTRHSTILRVEERFDDFNIQDANSNRKFMRVKAKKATMRGRKKVYAGEDEWLFDIIQKPFRFRPTFSVRGENKQELMKVKFRAIGRTAHATFTNAAGKPVTLTLKGAKMFGSKVEIIEEASKAPVASIERKRFDSLKTLARSAAGQDTYNLTVQPQVDAALIVAMCVCMDEKKEQQEAQRRR
ncbi:tubby C-terminal-like domain-containing protein [Corynascus similis CBS 632.67]